MSDFLPVILGSDAGAYSLARDFHESCGLTSITVTETPRGPINHSRIIHNIYLGEGGRKKPGLLLETLVRIASDNSDKTPILFPLIDSDVAFIQENDEALVKAGYILPLAEAEVIKQASNKRIISEIAAEIGYEPVPTVDVDMAAHSSDWSELEALRWPGVIKPREGSTTFKARSFAGHKKAYCVQNRSEAEHVLETIERGGYRGHMLVQNMILGDDSASWIMTGYVRRDGHIAAIATARQLIGLHQPQLIGNAGLIEICDRPDLRELASHVVTRLGLTGFFAMDVKVDSQSGKAYLLDVNTRWGRGSFFANLAGVSLAREFIRDLEGRAAESCLQDIEEGKLEIGESECEHCSVCGKDIEVLRRLCEERPQTKIGKGSYLYGIIPPLALLFWLPRSEVRAHATKLMRARRYVNPLSYSADSNLKRRAYIWAAGINQLRSLWALRSARGETRF